MGSLEKSTLLRSAIFEDISNDIVEEFCSRGRVISSGAGYTLFDRGQNADELMILQEGVVELRFPVQILGVTRAVTMEVKQAGDVVGWSALITPYRFTLSARTASKCILTGISRDSLQAFFETDPQTGYVFMRNLAGVVGRRLQAMQAIWMHDLQASAAKGLE
jgi:CRP-like cAMP-binding protein